MTSRRAGKVVVAFGRAPRATLRREPRGEAPGLLGRGYLDEYLYEALRAGASGFVLKDDPADQLIAAVRNVAMGHGLLSPAVTTRVIREFARTRRPQIPPGYSDLTEREHDVFRFLARGFVERRDRPGTVPQATPR